MFDFAGKPNRVETFKEEQVLPESNSKTERIFDDLFRDDFEGMDTDENIEDTTELSDEEVDEYINMLFEDDFEHSGENEEVETVREGADENSEQHIDLTVKYEPNSKFEVGENTYETDDEGNVYKINGKELVPNTEYTVNGFIYRTDDKGRIISCDGCPKQTPEGERDIKAQEMAGGEDRKEGDQGGHIMARILGGAKGIENMLAMRGPINQGSYHSMERDIDKALGEGKDVHVHVDVEYEGDSRRPSKIIVTYTIDKKETLVMFDNDVGSTDLLDKIGNKLDNEQIGDLKDEITDATADGADMSVIAAKIDCDDEGNIDKVTITMRDESTGGPNEKRVFLLKED